MATRADNAVTVSHEDAATISRLLQDYSAHLYGVAQRSKNAAIREHTSRTARKARDLADVIIRDLYAWTPA